MALIPSDFTASKNGIAPAAVAIMWSRIEMRLGERDILASFFEVEA
jgi:hypothetical protein